MATALAKAAALPKSAGSTWSDSTLTPTSNQIKQGQRPPEKGGGYRSEDTIITISCLVFLAGTSLNYSSFKLCVYLRTGFPNVTWKKKKTHSGNIKSSVSFNHILSAQFHFVYIRKQDSLLPSLVITWHLTPLTITIMLPVMASC